MYTEPYAPLATDYLEQQHAEAIHVGFRQEFPLKSLLRWHVAAVFWKKEETFSFKLFLHAEGR